MVCGDTGNGVGPLQHIAGLPVLAAGPGGGWGGLLHTLLGPHHRQRHVMRPAGQSVKLSCSCTGLYQPGVHVCQGLLPVCGHAQQCHVMETSMGSIGTSILMHVRFATVRLGGQIDAQ